MIKRLDNEIHELYEKMVNLGEFIKNNEIFNELSYEEQELMKYQLELFGELLPVLERRRKLFADLG